MSNWCPKCGKAQLKLISGFPDDHYTCPLCGYSRKA
jgi:hypothetical protein